MPWCWNEDTWCVRLYQSLKEARIFDETGIIPVLQWKPKIYGEKIGSIFPSVKGLRFYGTTIFMMKLIVIITSILYTVKATFSGTLFELLMQ